MSNATTLYDASFSIGGHPITWRDTFGTAFAVHTVVKGLRRRAWAWAIGIVGYVLSFADLAVGGLLVRVEASRVEVPREQHRVEA